MKIAFLTPEYPGGHFGPSGGIGTSIQNLAKGLVEQGNDVVVIIYGQDQDEVFEKDGIGFYSVKNVKFKGLSWYLTRLKIQMLINRLYRKRKLDVVEAPDWQGITAFMMLKCPVVVRLHGSDTFFCHHDGRKVKFFNHFLEKRALISSDLIIAVSHYAAAMTNDLFRTTYPMAVIPNGIDPSQYVPKYNSEGSTILYFGSIIRKKGLLELPLIFNQIARRNADARLLLVGKDVPDIITGEPSTWDMMRRLFEPRFLDRVQYIGEVPHDEIKQIVAESTVCVFPSFAEAMPLAWLEAMAMGKAIVGSDFGWDIDIFTNGVEALCERPTDHQKFASKIIKLLEKPKRRTEIATRARERIEKHFNSTYIAQQCIEVYQTVIPPSR